MRIKDGSYVVIQSWMVDELGLSGNELITYAVIHGFSQDGESWFMGSRAYLAAWCGTTTKSVTANLRRLLDKGLIVRRSRIDRGVTLNDYRTSPRGKKLPHPREETSLPPREETSPHKLDIDNDSENIDIPFDEIVGVLNDVAGTSFKASSEATRRLVRARWAEGYRLADFERVARVKASQWLGTDMEKYLRPQTLFGTKFEGYLNERTAERTEGRFAEYA